MRKLNDGSYIFSKKSSNVAIVVNEVLDVAIILSKVKLSKDVETNDVPV